MTEQVDEREVRSCSSKTPHGPHGWVLESVNFWCGGESGSTDMDIPAEAVEAAAKAILDEGGAPGHSIHSWRCEHPDRYGDCDCVQVTARAALEAAFPHLRPLFQHAASVGRELGRREVWEQVADAVSLGEEWQVEDPRISYVDVQIDKDAYLLLQEVLAARSVPPAVSQARSDGLSGSGVDTGNTEGSK